MSDFKAKMHQIRFPLGLRSRPRCGSLQRSPDPLAVLKGLLLREGGKRQGREGKGNGRGGYRGGRREGRIRREMRGREGREGTGSMHPLEFSKVGAYAQIRLPKSAYVVN